MTEAEQHLVDVAILMAQELQEYVDVGIECSGSNSAELATQELLKDWEAAYAAAGLTEDDHFKEYRGWHYPKDNSDMENMPEPGEIVVLFYEGDDGQTVGPVISTPVHTDPEHQARYMRTIRWHAIQEE